MANRSYLYSINQDKNGKISKAFDISEQGYELPIIYKILTSENTEIIPSPIFAEGFTLKGDASAGRKKLNAFFRKLIKADIFDKEELGSLEKELQEHLDKYTLDYYLFEPTEVLAMDECNFEEETKRIAKEMASYNKMIKNFLEDTCAECLDELGIYGSTYLYYSLGDKVEVEKIEKSFSNVKYAKIQALIAKKPTIKRYLNLIQEISWDTPEGKAERSEIIEKALKLDPDYEELVDLRHFHPDPKRKLEIIEQIIALYPDKEEETYYWKYSALKELGKYNEALEYYIKYILTEKNPLGNIYGLERLIEKSGGDVLEVYQSISKKAKIKRIEVAIIDELINKEKYDEALKYFREQQEFLTDNPTEDFKVGIVWSYLSKNHLPIAVELAQEFNEEVCVSNYYIGQKDYAKSVYFYMRFIDNANANPFYSVADIIEKFIDGELSNENIEIFELFSEVYSNIKEFKKETIKKASDDLLEEAEKHAGKISKDLQNVAYKLSQILLYRQEQ